MDNKRIEYFTFHDYYNKCSKENYNLYKIFEDKYNKLTDNNRTWDILDHKDKENEEYFLYSSNKQYYAILSIIFQSLSVEAYINYYGLKNLGEKEFNEHYEKICSIDKYVIIYKVIKSRNFPKGSKIFNDLKALFKIRNSLIHSKTVTIDMSDQNMQNFSDKIIKVIGDGKNSIFYIVDNIMDTYNQVIKLFEEN